MKLYIATTHGCYGEDAMKCYLAGYNYKNKIFKEELDKEEIKKVYILESFYYITDWQKKFIKKDLFKDFMLDSGAFTFKKKTDNVNWEEYLNKYIQFINKYDIDLFFELDIDPIVGYDKVIEFRKKLENRTGKKCIPVWHKSRGKDKYIELCKEYEYVAMGGLARPSKISYRNELRKVFPWFTKKAHKYDSKLHILGYTAKDLKEYEFDSVDSSAWTYGNRGKFLYNFNGKKMKKIDLSHKDNRMKAKKVAIHNFKEWVKYQKYLDGD